MRMFISGGCKNGKSLYAQKLAKCMQADDNELYYLATMVAKDSEDDARILRHKKERAGWGFKTIEIADDVLNAIKNCNAKGVFLLDSVTALLANEMFKDDGSIQMNAHIKVATELCQFLDFAENAVIVSDYIYSDAFIHENLTEHYRKGLATIDIAAAKKCDIVLESCYANLIVHKGANLFGGFNEIA